MTDRRRLLSRSAAVAVSIVVVLGAGSARAAGPPLIGAAWVTSVSATTAQLHGEVDPEGLPTTYHFSYLTLAAYNANLDGGKEAFSGAARIPVAVDANLGSGTAMVSVAQKISNLAADTGYRYRIVAKNSATLQGPAFSFTTQALGGGDLLLDGRGWEMVSPVDKNGGQVDPPGAIFGGGELQGADDGQSVTYGSMASFGAGAQGAPPASQYISTRTAAGWSTQNVTAPLYSASYGTEPQGVPYRLFSTDLVRGLLLNGEHCRGEAVGCAVANPPLGGTGAPTGYQNYYLRTGAAGGVFTALLGAEQASYTALPPADFDLRLAGASPDLRHVVLTSCAALTSDASEVPLGDGCDPAEQNLYLWSEGAGLELINTAPGAATLGAAGGAVSSDGSRVYWRDATGALQLHEGTLTKTVDAGAVQFQTATPDGTFAFYVKANHLHRYSAKANASVDLTPAGAVAGVLGASDDGSYAYYVDAGGLEAWHEGTITTIAPAADAANYPPSTGSARLSADGTRLAFLSEVMPIAYDNTDQGSGEPDSELFIYDAVADDLTCVSCNPTNARPLGPSSLPGALTNGEGPNATISYKPRALSADGRRVFFESDDSLVAGDTNGETDVYEWEESGTGSCAKSEGCLALVSSGKGTEAAVFVDASSDGSDAFFLTDDSLVGADPGAVDIYDARIGGGFPEPIEPIPCHGNDCQVLAPEPVDPNLNTLLAGRGNPPARYQRLGPKTHKPKKHRGHKKKGKGHKKGKGARR